MKPKVKEDQKTSAEIFKTNQEFYKSKLGKGFEIKIGDKKVKLFIAGFYGGTALETNRFLQPDLIFPEWVQNLDKTKIISEMILETVKVTGLNDYAVIFDTKENKENLIKKYTPKFDLISGQVDTYNPGFSYDDYRFSVCPYPSSLSFFKTVIDSFVYVILCISLLFMVLAVFMVLSTILKITSDSTKEIGVFRAIGAQRWDIAKIFLGYTFILLSSGILL